jgi:hypothetical protein
VLTLEKVYRIRGHTIFGDYGDPRRFFYLPDDEVRVSGDGRGLEFVAYTEDLTEEPDFSKPEDRVGAFLTLQVELGPKEPELEEIRAELARQTGTGDLELAQVPFTSGDVTLYVLGATGTASPGGAGGFEVSVAGSAQASLFGSQTAAFSVRLGGKAANVLYETLRTSADPQVVVCYSLKFLALRPAYNLEVEIDFKETFEYCRRRVGVNALIAKADLDLLTQELINSGSITVREVNFTGRPGDGTLLAGEGGILKLVRDLMSPNLFQTVPVPTPSYRALPDSAGSVLEPPPGTKQIVSASGGAGEASRPPVKAGTDLELTHTPIPGGQAPGTPVELPVAVKAAPGVTIGAVKLFHRVKGGAHQELVLQRTGTPPPAPVVPPAPPVVPPAPAPVKPAEAGVGDVPPPQPQSADQATFKGSIPGQPSGTTVEYWFQASATKAGGAGAISQTLPAQQAEAQPLSYAVGATATASAGGPVKVPETDGPLVGFSLQTMDVTQQVKRKFVLNRTEAVTQEYHPAGALAKDRIGPAFDPGRQVSVVALGEGPFRRLVIRAQAGFDFDTHHVVSAVVHIRYGRNAAGTGPLRALDIPLTKQQPTGQVQFFADQAGTQDYDYFVSFTYDPDRVVGAAGRVLRSQTLTGVTSRSITVDLDQHSPVKPVEVLAGHLQLDDGLVRQVQVRVAPTADGEGRTVLLRSGTDREVVYVLPADPANPSYHLRQTFFSRDDATVVERPDARDTQVVVNEPSDLVFRMVPQLVDPGGLVGEVLVDASYTHADGEQELATLHLNPEQPRSEFGVLLRGNDRREWQAAPRFLLRSGEPLIGQAHRFVASEPFISLAEAGFRVATAELLEDPSIFRGGDLLAIKVLFGRDVTDRSLPVATVLLRESRTSASVVVPGLPAGAAVSVATDLLRRGQPPLRTVTELSASETTLFVTL